MGKDEGWRPLSLPLSHLQMVKLLGTPLAVGQIPDVVHCHGLSHVALSDYGDFD